MATFDQAVMRGLLAARPAPSTGTAGRLYFATDDGDDGALYRDSGSAWEVYSGTQSHSHADYALAADFAAHEADIANPHEVTANQVGAAAAVHTHDDRYYTESEVDALLTGKASSVHAHDAADVISGTFGVARGGTGLSTVAAGRLLYASAADTLAGLVVGSARQLLQMNAAGTLPEWASNLDVPGTLDVTGNAIFDNRIGVGAPVPATPIHIANFSPGIRQELVRSSGGFAFGYLECTATNSTTALTSQIAQVGVFGNLQSGVTAPTLTFFYLSSLPSPAYNNANLFLHASGNVSVGVNNTSDTAAFHARGSVAATRVQIVQAAASQTANLTEWRNSAATGLSAIDASGRAGFGTATPSAQLHTLLTSATTNAADTVAIFGHNSSGTPGEGFGGGLQFRLKSSTTVEQNAARLAWLWDSATHAGRTADLVAYATDFGAERELWRGRANGSAAAIGFLGASPVARPNVTGSRGGNLALMNLLTALANLGLITDSTVL